MLFTRFERRDNVWVIQRSGSQNFGAKTTNLLFGRKLSGTQHLQSNRSAKVAMNGTLNDPHAATIDLLDQIVLPKA